MWPTSFQGCEQQPLAKFRLVLNVIYLCNLSNSALTSTSLISFLLPGRSVTVSPAHVSVCRLCLQDCAFVSVQRLFTVACHSYFTFSRPQMLRCIFNIGKEWGWSAERQLSSGSCACEPSSHHQPAPGLPPHWAAQKCTLHLNSFCPAV